jgi:hypothetical protein
MLYRTPFTYEVESVNRPQMDINRKTCDIRTCRSLFLDISSTKIDTIIPSLYQCVKTCSLLTIVSATPATPFHHLRLSSVLERISRPSCEPLYAIKIPTVNRKHFFMNILCIKPPFFFLKCTTERCSSVVYYSSTVAILKLKPASEHEHLRLLPRLS